VAYRVVLDSNVLISAVVFGGKPRRILQSIIRGKVGLAVSEVILEEVTAVLAGRKFQFPSRVVHAVLTEIRSMSELVDPRVRTNEIKKDPDDNGVLECAVESKADYIVSGDMHLLELGTFKGISIMNPTDFIETVGI
jgi:putative PIN family toxin of toxin-antitoxin system